MQPRRFAVRPTDKHPMHRFTLAQKASLVAEITGSYLRARRWLRGSKVDEAVAIARRDASKVDPPEYSTIEAFQLAFRLGRIVDRGLDRLPGDTRCLTRSVVLVHLLARRGIDSTLVIGVKPHPFEAHAWVEYEGEALLSQGEFAAGRLTEI